MRRTGTIALALLLALGACGPSTPGPGAGAGGSIDLRVLPPEYPVPEDCPMVPALAMALLATPVLPGREGAATLEVQAWCEGEDGPGPEVQARWTISIPNEPDVRVEGSAQGPVLPGNAPEWDRALALARVIAAALDNALAQYEVLRLSGREVSEWLDRSEAPPRAVLLALLDRADRSSLKALVRLATGPDEEVAFRAVGALSRIGGREGAAALGRVAVEGGAEVALAAVIALGELPLEDGERALELVAGQSAREVVRLRALWYLGRGPDREGD